MDVSERTTVAPTRAVRALLVWAGLIVLAYFLGLPIVHHKPRTGIFAPPLVARFDPRFPVAAFLPVACAIVVVASVPRLMPRMTWRRLLALSFAVAAAWAVSLALTDGVSELTRPLREPVDYLHDVPLVGTPGAFLSTFVHRIGRYHQHVRAHPPGMVLLLWMLDRAGLRGAGWEAFLEIGGGAAMVPAALIALREWAGEPRARAAAPFIAVAPIAVWIATSGDALFAGVSTWAVTLIILAVRRSDLRSDVLALGGGLLFGGALMLSYGVLVLAAIPAMVAFEDRRARPLIMAAVGASAVLLAFTAAGFWWASGLRASLVQYRTSVARFRPLSYFWLGDLAAFAIALGPATAAGLATLRDRRTWLLVGGGLLAVAVADASGLSKAEVERIWLPFAPWVLMAGSALAGPNLANPFGSVRSRAWLASTLGAGLAIQLLLRTVW